MYVCKYVHMHLLLDARKALVSLAFSPSSTHLWWQLRSAYHSSIHAYQRLQIIILLSNHLNRPCIFPLIKKTDTYI